MVDCMLAPSTANLCKCCRDYTWLTWRISRRDCVQDGESHAKAVRCATCGRLRMLESSTRAASSILKGIVSMMSTSETLWSGGDWMEKSISVNRYA